MLLIMVPLSLSLSLCLFLFYFFFPYLCLCLASGFPSLFLLSISLTKSFAEEITRQQRWWGSALMLGQCCTGH